MPNSGPWSLCPVWADYQCEGVPLQGEASEMIAIPTQGGYGTGLGIRVPGPHSE